MDRALIERKLVLLRGHLARVRDKRPLSAGVPADFDQFAVAVVRSLDR